MDDRSPMTLTEEQVALSEKDVEELTRRIEVGVLCDVLIVGVQGLFM